MLTKNDLVSVLMCVHNENNEYLNIAIQSICKQTYKNIEIIIVDDASAEDCKTELNRLQSIFPIIRIVHNKKNIGITKSLNVGLLECKGKYIARMDADDFSHPLRIEKQVKYLQSHPEIDIVGCGVVTFGKYHTYFSPAFGIGNDNVQCELFFTSTLCHPAVMIRTAFLHNNNLKYNPQVDKGQDYELWERASVHGKLAVMSEVLLYYRIHSKQISSTNNSQQQATTHMVMKRRLNRLGLKTDDENMEAHLVLAGFSINHSTPYVEWAESIMKANKALRFVSDKVLYKNLSLRMVTAKYRINGIRKIGVYSVREYYLLLKIAFVRICMKLMLQIAIKQFNKTYRKLKNELL